MLNLFGYDISMNSLGINTTSKQLGSLRYMERTADNDSNAPTIVFLHGNSFSSAVFQNQFESSLLRDFRLIAFDLPGHGRSKPISPEIGYTFGSLADAVIDGLAALDLKDVVLAGWSLGGHVALEMLDRTPRVAGAMIFGTPPLHAGALSSIRAYHFSRDMFLISKAQLSPVDAIRLEKFCIGPNANGEHINAIEKSAPNVRTDVFKSVLQGKNRDQYDLAVGATKPLSILNGADDPLVRASYIQSIAENPGYSGEVAMIDDAGHAPFIDQTLVFDFMLSCFARRVATGENATTAAHRHAA